MRRGLALCLSLVFLLVTLPLSTWAENEVASGTCGHNLTWILDDSGTLTITGEGEMEDYDSYDTPPWQELGISHVVVGNDIHHIGSYAFSNCTNLIDISFSDSVVSVGKGAFDNTGYYNNKANWDGNVLYLHGHLIAVDRQITGSYAIKSGTKSITDEAFASCYKLTAITIPDSVLRIGENAFYNCTKLSQITFPNSSLVIENGAFHSCHNLINITFPDGVSYIGSNAFYNCDLLTHIAIPDSVTHIGDGAFSSCDNLSTIVLPSDPIYIGENAFSNTAYYNDESNWSYGILYIQEHLIDAKQLSESYAYTIRNGTKNIADGAFSDHYNLTNISIPDSVIRIGNNAFSYCSRLANITLPDHLTYMGANAFYSCSNLKSITIPDTVTYIGQNAFSVYSGPVLYGGLNSYAQTYAKENGITFFAIDGLGHIIGTCGDNLFWSLNQENTLTISGKGNMDDYVWSYESPWYGLLISDVVLLPGVTGICMEAFSSCYDLTSISIPASVINIDDPGYNTLPRSCIIYGQSGTCAEEYATTHDIAFISTSPQPIYFSGNVDGLDDVTASDALMALQAATGKITLTEEQQAAADVNGDESVAAGDALLILQYATRKIAQFPKAA